MIMDSAEQRRRRKAILIPGPKLIRGSAAVSFF